MPEGAKRVFAGEIFDVYQWEQEMFDGSTATFERLKRPDTVAIVATRDGEVLLSREIQPHWQEPETGLLGGRVDAGESPLAAAKRELKEEAGLVSDDWELLFTVSPVKKMEWTIHCFAARNCEKVCEPMLDAGEQLDVLSVPFEEFVRIATAPGFRSSELSTRLLRMQLDGTVEEFRSRLFS